MMGKKFSTIEELFRDFKQREMSILNGVQNEGDIEYCASMRNTFINNMAHSPDLVEKRVEFDIRNLEKDRRIAMKVFCIMVEFKDLLSVYSNHIDKMTLIGIQIKCVLTHIELLKYNSDDIEICDDMIKYINEKYLI